MAHREGGNTAGLDLEVHDFRWGSLSTERNTQTSDGEGIEEGNRRAARTKRTRAWNWPTSHRANCAHVCYVRVLYTRCVIVFSDDTQYRVFRVLLGQPRRKCSSSVNPLASPCSLRATIREIISVIREPSENPHRHGRYDPRVSIFDPTLEIDTFTGNESSIVRSTVDR